MRIGQYGLAAQARLDAVVGRFALEHTLPAGGVSDIVALQQALQRAVGADGDDEHVAADAAVEALDHTVIRQTCPMLAVCQDCYSRAIV